MDVIWTAPAEKSLTETIRYVKMRTGEVTARKVWQMIRKQVELLVANPYMGKVDTELSSARYQYRFIIVNKRSKVYYFIEESFIYITLVWDTRQDPETLKDLLFSLP